jgi:hypothetical protein
MTFRSRIILTILWLSSLVAVAVWAQERVHITGPPRMLSGSDIAFRIDRMDVEGTPVGSLLVKIDGKWVEPAFTPRMKPMAR